MKTLQDYKSDYDKLLIKKNLTGEDALEAVYGNGLIFRYVRDQTEDACLAAVQQNGLILRFIHNQTDKICLAAVQQDGYALQYVRDQTEAICLAAIQQNIDALKYVRDDMFKDEQQVEIDGKKFSVSTIKEALREYVK